ncbi:IclR family transcriptional regulator [Microlunatus parietis]|uniref:DNA-binding IclR family transcriptional regulator n=1 Tax=Microlunatus parietis TaxID=682979 RepID=A0A7Y9I397_9ACTN|nr:IclR family transcriptional regulator [Microlunatus parietis]NYE69383.1 DNA-binding IclR family transcriptional regulator [Microlunatus parietis]
MTQPRGPVKSADRALAAIDLVAALGSASFAEIAEALQLPRSSAHGLLGTLVDAGWLDVSAEPRRYRLGLHAWQIGQRYDGHRLLLEKAKPLMDALVGATGETVQLARLDGVENVYIGISLSPNPMRMASSVGMRLHAHATGIGKALLSVLDEADARARLESVVLPQLTPRTLTDVDEILAAVGRAREVGFATDDEEFVAGCRCVAVPLTTERETGIASAMSLTMPTARTDGSWPHGLYPPLRDAAQAIREQLGLTGSLSP